MEAAEALDLIRTRIVASFAPEQIILFGSTNDGRSGPDSDLDILVVFPSVPDKREARVSLYNALRGIPFPKDIFVAGQDEISSGNGASIVREAMASGRTIYKRGAAPAEFK